MASMFDFVREQKWLVRIFLILICVPFALFGVEWYQRSSSGVDTVAEVAGEKISVFEFNQRLQAQQDQFRQILGRNFDPTMLDNPQARQGLLDQIVQERVLTQYIARRNFMLGDNELQQAIADMADFQENGAFSRERYQQLLKSSGRSPLQFQEDVRRSLAFQRLGGALRDAGIGSKSLAKQAATFGAESREISEFAFVPSQYIARVKIDPAAAEAYYKDNTRQFEVPERVKAEYVVLNLEMASAQFPVDAAEVKKMYEERFAGRAKQRSEARKKAEELLAKVRANPESFIELAKANSEDPGSKESGGDLGFNARGSMVKPFDDTVFRLKPKEISGIVETEFGFHLIMLEEIKPGGQAGKAEERRARHILVNAPEEAKSFDAARTEIEREVRRQRAQSEFPKLVERFTNQADQQLDSLKPLADEFKLELQTSDWIPRSGGQAAGVLGNARMVSALFSSDSLKSKRSTEAVEVSNGVYIVARPIEHQAQGTRSLDDVRAEIIKQLSEKEARELARKDGEARLEGLLKGKDANTKWGAAKTVSREKTEGLGRDALRAVFRAGTGKLPAYAGAESPEGGYVVYRISKVDAAGGTDDKSVDAARDNLERASGAEQFQSFVAGLRGRTKVEVNRASLERKGG